MNKLWNPSSITREEHLFLTFFSIQSTAVVKQRINPKMAITYVTSVNVLQLTREERNRPLKEDCLSISREVIPSTQTIHTILESFESAGGFI